MSFRNREIESKLLVYGKTLEEVNSVIQNLFREETTRKLLGSSLDHYWTISNPNVDADFVRVRERDGCCQVTVKARDRGTALNRMEKEYTTTANLRDVLSVTEAQHGKVSGRVSKTYYVYWIGGEYTTVCAYQVTEPKFHPIVVEVETTHMSKLVEIEAQVLKEFSRQDIQVERAPGSLYEMLVVNNGVK